MFNSKEYAGILASIFGIITGENVIWPIEEISENFDFGPNFKERPKRENIAIFPNPTSQRIININGLKLTEETKVSIYSPTGQLIFNKKLESTTLDLAGFAAGLYIVKFELDTATRTEKLILN